MKWHDVKLVAQWYRMSIRRRSWEQGVAYKHDKWESRYSDRRSPEYGHASNDWINLTMTMAICERRMAEGKTNIDDRRDYAICDATDWCLADYDTRAELEHLPYGAAIILARRGFTVRRASWPAHWRMIHREKRGDLDDGAAICDSRTGQLMIMPRTDRVVMIDGRGIEVKDWQVVE